MIVEVDGSIFDDLPKFSVLLHQCNAKGWMGAGIAKEIRIRYPKAYDEYHRYCSWFKNGHEHEILGTFVGVKIRPDLIICNAIAQESVSRNQQVTDYNAWNEICKKLEYQTRIVNQKTNCNWSIHIPYNVGCGLGGGDWNIMYEMFEKYFKHSTVKLVIHKY